MDYQLKSIKKILSNYIDMSDDEWAQYSLDFRIKQFKKKAFLLKPGEISRDIFFVNEGLLRLFFINNDGEEKTFHFSLEHTFAAEYKSFLKKTPSIYGIQALEDTKVVLMSYDMLHNGYKILKNGEKLGRLIAEDYFFLFNDKIQSMYTKSLVKQYEEMNLRFPGILTRIPQHYLASYLNISPVHLSRLKNSK